MQRSFLLSLLVLCIGATADAATITVTNGTDGPAPGPGGSLRRAIADASPGDTIAFSLPSNSAVTLTTGPLVIAKQLTIKGPGAKLLAVQRSSAGGTPEFNIFRIDAGQLVTLSGLTIANGRALGSPRVGGGVHNRGTTSIVNCTISGNHADSSGGAISNESGTLNIHGSTLTGNSSATGGALYQFQGSVTITRSTISGNTGVTPGGGIYAVAGDVSIISSTITDNRLTGENSIGGGISVATSAGIVTARNAIIAGNFAATAPDISGPIRSYGYVLIGNTNGTNVSGNDPGNQFNVNPLLDTLRDNGGSTLTHALLSGSPAIEGGHGPRVSDQRGLTGLVDDPNIPNAGDGTDIGAYEVQADVLPGCSGINRIVNTTTDGGPGSLRGVIASVCAGSTITFADHVRGAITLTSGELLVSKSVTITGPGADLLRIERSAAAGTPFFRVFNLSDPNSLVAVSGLTIANGSNSGGGIFNTGYLTVSDCAIIGNVAMNGGGIYNDFLGQLDILRSTLSGNTVSSDWVIGNGGGIYNRGGTVNLTSSTVSGNTALGPGGNSSSGAGIMTDSGSVNITNSTVTGNSGNRGGGIRNVGSTVTTRNSVIALNTSPEGPDALGALISGGFNLIGSNSGAAITPAHFTDQIGRTAAQVNLGPLQNNGGRTQTHALLSGSVAIDKGHSSGVTNDQRGFARPVDLGNIVNATNGDGGDIGAFEFGAAPLPVPVVSIGSRKAHGANGPFEISLLTATAVECRTGGATNAHTIVFKFVNPISNVGGVDFTGVGTVSGAAVGANSQEYVVSLTGVANAQRLTVTLRQVTDSSGNFSDAIAAPMGVLVGDSTGNGSVTASDIGQVKGQSGRAVTSANFWTDVTANGGSITASDIGQVKSVSGTQLP